MPAKRAAPPDCWVGCSATGRRQLSDVGQIFSKTIHCSASRSTQTYQPRLLGHWGTSPGLSLIYVHLNRLIPQHDANMIFLAGPGHGGPAILANVYLEGTYTEVYPKVRQTRRDAAFVSPVFDARRHAESRRCPPRARFMREVN